MTVRYANAAGSDTSPYDTVAKGATNPQTILDLATAGDECRCYGSFTLSAALDIDTANGTASSPIKLSGCNASGDVDGTLATFDGNSAATNCIAIAASYGAYWFFENLLCTGATDDGISLGSNSGTGRRWNNVESSDNSGSGWNLYYSTLPDLLIKCKANRNSNSGFEYPYGGPWLLFCEEIDNGSDGIGNGAVLNKPLVVIGNVIHSNGGKGIDAASDGIVALFNVIDENDSDGLDVGAGAGEIAVAIGNRFTGNGAGGTGYGISETGSAWVSYGWNVFLSNQDGTVNGDCYAIADGSDTDTNETSGTEGYTDGDNDDFNLTASATLRSVAIALD